MPTDFVFFIICYKVIDVYLSNIHFHNTDTLIARNIDTLYPNQRYMFIMCVRYNNIHKLIDIPNNIHIYLELNSLSETI